MSKHEHPPQNTVPNSPGEHVSETSPETTETPPHPGHQCDKPPGFPSFKEDLDVDQVTFIPERLIEAAVHEVLYALQQFNFYMSNKIEAICKEHLPPEAKAEWSKYWGPFDEAIGTHLRLTLDVTSELTRVNASSPPQVTTMEDMLHQLLDNADFCCSGAVDEYVTHHSASLMDFCGRQLPEFDPAWLTLAGAKERGSY